MPDAFSARLPPPIPAKSSSARVGISSRLCSFVNIPRRAPRTLKAHCLWQRVKLCSTDAMASAAKRRIVECPGCRRIMKAVTDVEVADSDHLYVMTASGGMLTDLVKVGS